MNKSTGGKVICIEHDGQLKITRPDLEEQCCSEVVVDQTLYVKEKYNISNQAYHEMAMVNKCLPRACTLLKVSVKAITTKCTLRHMFVPSPVNFNFIRWLVLNSG